MKKFCPADPDASKLAGLIDHTLLKADATTSEISRLCEEALYYGFASVCVNQIYVKKAVECIADSNVKICTVIGFPLGATYSEIKAAEAHKALSEGANEIDMVICVGALKEGKIQYVADEIELISSLTSNAKAILKVIIETALLTDEEKITACKIIADSGGDFVKTSTGFAKGGATLADIRLLKQYCGTGLKIKASGGIRTFEDAIAMVEAGADRIGTSSSVNIVCRKTDN